METNDHRRYYLCEADNTLNIVAPIWIEPMVYLALLLYYMDKYIQDIELDDINLEIKDIESALSGLASGKYDLHTGLYVPLQNQYYVDYVGRDILIQHEFIDSFKSFY